MSWKTDNNTLRILALVIAVILWMYVGTVKDPITERTYQVPVSIQNLDDDKMAALSSETVRLTVRGRQDRLTSLDENDFTASVDLKGLDEGEHSVDVQVSSPGMVTISDVSPNPMNVHIDRRNGQYMPVTVIQTGTLPDGISVDSITVDPKNVFVSGETSVLNEVMTAGVTVDLSTLTSSGDTAQTVVFYDSSGSQIPDEVLTSYPEEVSVSVKVNESEVDKEVPITANLSGSLPEGYSITGVTVEPATAKVKGSPADLADIVSVDTEPIDVSSLTASTEVTAALTGDYLKEDGSVTVHLTVAKDANASGQTSVKMLAVHTEGAQASAVSLDPALVQVTYRISGNAGDPAENLQAFVVVDTLPPEEGTSAVVQITAGDGFVVDNVSPRSVKVYPVSKTSTKKTTT